MSTITLEKSDVQVSAQPSMGGRNLGLDIARSIAIIMVLISHARGYFRDYFDSAKWSIFGVLGVEVFFVLSGFLIGKIIMKDVANLKWKSLRHFYIRRWFRTLPLYYLMLAFYMIVYRQFHWEHFLFIQNYRLSAYEFFTASWSLSVEEWFYLTVPFIIILISRLTKFEFKKVVFGVCFAIITLTLVARIIYVTNFNPPWDYGIRVNTFLRLDGIMFGVMLAGIRTFYRGFYDKVTKYSKHLLLISLFGLLSVGIYYVYFKGAGRFIDRSFFARTFMFSYIPFVVMFLIAALESDNVVNNVFNQYKISNIFRFVSRTSYGLYLINYDLYQFALRIYKGTNIYLSLGWLIVTLAMMFTIVHLLHKYYEQPMMNLREKFN